ncbi:MAG TPA: hypothetical protein VHR66_30265 [Gemmataceae bacterium]|jgi:hypothetical protein|nr:hypothetical protein [Gemmataceae bacterium]
MLDQLETLIAFALIMLLLSLIIMTIVQSFNVALQRRGHYLLWGIEQVIKQIGADDKIAKDVSKAVLQYAPLSAAGWVAKIPLIGKFFTTATAIRPEELAKVLGRVLPTTVPAGSQGNWYASALAAADALEQTLVHKLPDFFTLSALLQGLGVNLGTRASQGLPPSATPVAPADLQSALLTALKDQASAGALTLAGSLQAVATKVVAELNRLVPAGTATIPSVAQMVASLQTTFETELNAHVASLSQKAADLKEWFDMVMDRTTERFVSWTRLITIFTSFVFCLVYQVDALDLLKQLYTDKQARAALIAQVDPTLKQAEGIMALPSTGLSSEALHALESQLKAAGYTGTIPNDLNVQSQGQDWIKKNIAADQQANIVAKFDAQFGATAQKRLDDLEKARNEAKKTLSSSQLRIIHTSDEIEFTAWRHALADIHHLGGILMAGILLSLGAPFWFNTLKSLSNLRPILATRVQAEEQGTAPKK